AELDEGGAHLLERDSQPPRPGGRRIVTSGRAAREAAPQPQLTGERAQPVPDEHARDPPRARRDLRPAHARRPRRFPVRRVVLRRWRPALGERLRHGVARAAQPTGAAAAAVSATREPSASAPGLISSTGTSAERTTSSAVLP